MWSPLPDADMCYSKCTHSLWIKKMTWFTVYVSHAQVKSHLIGLWYRQHCTFWTSTDISWLKCFSAYGRGFGPLKIEFCPFFICTTLTFNLTILSLFIRIQTFFPKNSDFLFSIQIFFLKHSTFSPHNSDFFFSSDFRLYSPSECQLFFLRITILFFKSSHFIPQNIKIWIWIVRKSQKCECSAPNPLPYQQIPMTLECHFASLNCLIWLKEGGTRFNSMSM